jgi:hypothetical protein
VVYWVELRISPEERMTTVANCFDLTDALRLKTQLEAAGITAFIPDETTAGIVPYHFLTSSGVRLQVLDEHVEEARAILAREKDADQE